MSSSNPLKSVIIIANPTAGIGKGNRRRIVKLAARDLWRHGYRVQTCIESSPNSVSMRAAQSALNGVSIIIAAGGDGTVNAVVNGMMQASVASGDTRKLSNGTALGILPLGTGNVFAYNMQIPEYWRDACRIIRAGQRRRIDLGRAALLSREDITPQGAQRYFLLMAGIGFDAKVMEDTSLRLKHMLREFAYALKSLQNAVTYRGSHVTLTVGEKIAYTGNAWLIMVGNAASYAWKIRFTERAKLDDGKLDICLMPYANRFVSVRQVAQLLKGQHIKQGSAEYWQTNCLRVESDPPMPVQLDGDEWATTPLELEIHPGAIEVIAPTNNIDSVNPKNS